jgi:hypothetical protein
MLAGCCTESELKAKGFTIGLLGGLIRAGLESATPTIVEAGGRSLGVVRLAVLAPAPDWRSRRRGGPLHVITNLHS